MKRVFLIVIDGLGVGAQEDAFHYGDADANTLKSALEGGLELGAKPLIHFAQLGLGTLLDPEAQKKFAKLLPGHESNLPEASATPFAPTKSSTQDVTTTQGETTTQGVTTKPSASVGMMREVSAGKDSTTGHWELAGLHLAKPFPTYPDGFPNQILDLFCRSTGVEGVLCNKPYSGTDVIRDFGDEHRRTGKPIVYTSADSVFQIAAHTDTIPLETLYEWCRIAREEICTGDHEVGRVIARPFTGSSGSYERISSSRKDYSSIPPKPNLMSLLRSCGIRTLSIGKVADLFASEGFDETHKTKSNRDGLNAILKTLKRSFPADDQEITESNESTETNESTESKESFSAGVEEKGVFVFANLIDTDQLFGHRQDPQGYYECLREIDDAIPAILKEVKNEDLIIITGDHGNDPGDQSTDHTREFVPLFVLQKAPDFTPSPLGVRDTFSDVSATILEYFSCDNNLKGQSFL